jgi:hypothetical protein
MRALTIAGVGVASTFGIVHAQTLRGRVLSEDSTRLAGIVIVATAQDDSAAAQTMSSANGEFVLALPHPGRYDVRALRIGYQPTFLRNLTLSAREDLRQDIVLALRPVVLPVVSVGGSSECDLTSQTGEAFVQLWERARAAVSAAWFPEQTRELAVRFARLDGEADANGSHVRIDSLHPREGISNHLFTTTPAETLATKGYVRPVGDGRILFDMPSAPVLVSDAFIAQHCFGLRQSADRGDWIGVTFRPKATRDTLGDIVGTAWLERGTSELERLEFSFTNVKNFTRRLCDAATASPICVAALPPDAAIGGWIDFARITPGVWLPSRWLLRTPAEAVQFRQGAVGERSTARGNEACFGGVGCQALMIPKPRLSTTETIVLSIADNGTVIYDDKAATAMFDRLVVARAGKHPSRIVGTVAAADGHALAGALLQTDDPARIAIADSAGRFVIPTLPPGPVSVGVRCRGYDAVRFRMTLRPDSTHRVAVQLKPAQRRESQNVMSPC